MGTKLKYFWKTHETMTSARRFSQFFFKKLWCFFFKKLWKNNFLSRNCETVSWNSFLKNLIFLPTLQLQLRNVSQLKDNVHETHLFWKYPTYIAVLSFFNYFNFLPMLEWFKLGFLLFRLISINGQLTKHCSNES